MIDPRTRRPEEGWLSLALVGLMIAVVASAVDDPAWVNGRGYLTDGLVWLGLLGVAVGFIGPKVGWGRWTTHAVGALFAGLLIPIVAGWAEYPARRSARRSGTPPTARSRRTSTSRGGDSRSPPRRSTSSWSSGSSCGAPASSPRTRCSGTTGP